MTCDLCRKWAAPDSKTLNTQLSALRSWPESLPMCPRCKRRDWATSTEGLVKDPVEKDIDWAIVAVVLVIVVATIAVVVMLFTTRAATYWEVSQQPPLDAGTAGLVILGLAVPVLENKWRVEHVNR